MQIINRMIPLKELHSWFEAQYEAFVRDIESFRNMGMSVFASSSFQTNSVLLLHMVSRCDPDLPVYFLNTGYHFPETLAYKSQLTRRLGLRNVVDVRPAVSKAHQRDPSGLLLYASDPDCCCHINKVLPMEPVRERHDVWMSGLRGVQNAYRAGLERIVEQSDGKVRFHPFLEWGNREVHRYRILYELPPHPLEELGYFSVGCQPCTRRVELSDAGSVDAGLGDGRDGRWRGLRKTECGLHTSG